MNQSTSHNSLRLVEWAAATVGAVNCVLVSVAFVQPNQPMFPLPGLYLIEVALLGLIVIAFVAARPRLDTRWNAVPWVASGLLLTFVILGGFSIGFFLIPALIAFAVTGLMVDLQSAGFNARHLGFFLVAAVAQGAVMALFMLLA